MRPNERRRRIIEILNLRRHDTMQNLAHEFGVSRLTIYRDILILEEEYPVVHTSGRSGGIGLPDGYYLSKRYLSPRQADAIRRNLDVVYPNDRENLSKYPGRLCLVWLSRVFTLTTSYPARQVRPAPSEQHGRVRRDVRRRLRTERFDLSPQAAPAGRLATTWGGPTMIRLQPRASDGVAEPRLRSLDPGRASERLSASSPPAVFPMPGVRAAK